PEPLMSSGIPTFSIFIPQRKTSKSFEKSDGLWLREDEFSSRIPFYRIPTNWCRWKRISLRYPCCFILRRGTPMGCGKFKTGCYTPDFPEPGLFDCNRERETGKARSWKGGSIHNLARCTAATPEAILRMLEI